MTYEQLIEKGEKERELGNISEALSLFEQAILVAITENRITDVVEALGQKLLVYKHHFQTTQNTMFLEFMRSDIETGMRLVEKHNLDGHPKAVMNLRMGDYYLENKAAKSSVPYYKAAVDALPEVNPGMKAEFISHYGRALVEAGDGSGIDLTKEALVLAEKDETLRPFHRLIILSGIHMRLVVEYMKLDNKAMATEHLNIAEQQSQQLADEHHMVVRLAQAKQLHEHFGI